MKRFLIMAIMAVVGSTAVAQTQNKSKLNEFVNEKALYVIDGKVCSKGDFEKLLSGEIKNIKVVKGIEEAIIVDTKSGNSKANEDVKIVGIRYIDPESDKEVAWSDTSVTVKKEVKPIIITGQKTTTTKINGDTTTLKVVMRSADKNAQANLQPVIIVRDNEGNQKVVKDMKEVKVETIKSVTVFKGSKAELFKQYGDVTYGVVFIELK